VAALRILSTIDEVRAALAPARAAGQIGLVPTMGAFHQGHTSLFRAARAECRTVVVSLFVNPTQFGDPLDLAKYPRDEARDRAIAEGEGADFLFAPAAPEMYPSGFGTWIDVEGAAAGLEGEFRPGHFRGVATVCLKLFAIVRPDIVYFGQKDAQQVAVIEQLIRDLDLGIALRVCPTVRDVDGLALSSRNARLSAAERLRALAIPRALEAGVAAYHAGSDPVGAAAAMLGELDVEYVAVREFRGRPTLAIAARMGAARLIDNVLLDEPPSPAVSGVAAKEAGRD
jgi:pantoate--beta-alanine ligase